MLRSRRVVILLVFGLVGCTNPRLASGPAASPTPAGAPTSSAPRTIDEAERRWQGHAIASYRIEVRRVESLWHAQWQTITVRDGRVVDQTARCVPAPAEGGKCEVRPFNAEDYTVPGLFAQARSQVATQTGGRETRLTFDPTYGFPSAIASTIAGAYDADLMIGVDSFVLSGGQ